MERTSGASVYRELYDQIGYEFKDDSFLKLALRHPSMGPDNNQRLEFLGDAVLQLCISDRIFHIHTRVREGEMTSIRQKLVCEQALSAIARDIGLGKYLFMEHGLEESGGRLQPGPLSDAMEALLAAVYLDGGFQAAYEVIHRLWEQRNWADVQKTDGKSALQEYTQAALGTIPEYAVVEEKGPAHDRVFVVVCRLSNGVETISAGKSKKKAEQAAAEQALRLLKTEEKNKAPLSGESCSRDGQDLRSGNHPCDKASGERTNKHNETEKA